LSIRKNERKGESDEPDAPLLGEGENSAWEGDVVIGRKESDQANNTANDGFQQSFAIEPKPPPGRWRIHAWHCPSARAAMATPCCGSCKNRTSPHRG
jgi:hypothetical protein